MIAIAVLAAILSWFSNKLRFQNILKLLAAAIFSRGLAIHHQPIERESAGPLAVIVRIVQSAQSLFKKGECMGGNSQHFLTT